MTANNGWPGKPGVPRDPHQSGWHWLSGATERPAAFEWLAHKQAWLFHRAQPEAQAMPPPAFGSWTYLGPVLTPDEAAKREDVKWHEGYAVGVLDVRRGTAFGEPDPHYAALQARVAKLETALQFIKDAPDEEREPNFDNMGSYEAGLRYSAAFARAALTGGKDE